MDDFKLGILKSAIGTHTTDKDKREFMLRLYDIRSDMIMQLSGDYTSVIRELNILLLRTSEIYQIHMPDYYKGTIWLLQQQH